MMGLCYRCGVNKTVFWHRLSYGCDGSGDGGQPFDLCDRCFLEFNDFMRARMKKGEE